jgi:hypothetical protein
MEHSHDFKLYSKSGKCMSFNFGLSILSMIGGWGILIGIGWLIISHIPHPAEVAIAMIIAGVFVKYVPLFILRTRIMKEVNQKESQSATESKE